MTVLSGSIFYILLIASPFSLLISMEIGLVSMLTSWISALVILSMKSTTKEGGTKVAHWLAWGVHGMFLVAVYMVIFGVANIVGSGRKFSSRMAVSTLRTLHWAERQCIPKAGRLCTIGELKGEVKLKGLNTRLLRTDFKHVVVKETKTEFGRLGQYYFLVNTLPTASKLKWVAYAWPVTDLTLQSFCIDQNEEILELPIPSNQRSVYLGLEKPPLANACRGSLHEEPNPPLTNIQKEAIAAGQKPPPHTHVGADQNVWQRWRGKRTRINKTLAE